MGWWKIDVEDQPDAVMGDNPADFMGDAVDNIMMEYMVTWNRRPTMSELQNCLEFVTAHLDLEDKVEKECLCNWNEKMTGDGCYICNPDVMGLQPVSREIDGRTFIMYQSPNGEIVDVEEVFDEADH